MISLLVPSRGRPDSFAAMRRSAHETASAGIEIVARLDDDDQSLPKYGDALVGPRSTLSGLWNECAAAATGDILMQASDDIRFRTPGWDQQVRKAVESYPDPIVYVYGRDGIADERMATHGFMHRVWYETLGYFTWPEFSSDYGDLWNHTIAERLGRLHYLPDVYTEHLHPAAGKAEYDQTHLERMERDEGGINAHIWERAQPDLDRAVSVLAGLLHQPNPTDR